MMQKIPFVKMQGAGNDYVYIDTFSHPITKPNDLAKKISDRHFGVGSDGLVLLCPSTKADLKMRMFNADGSEAEMCGNASRCVAKLAYDKGLVTKPDFTLETGAGIKAIHLDIKNNKIEDITVDMGEPVLEMSRIPFHPPKDILRQDSPAKAIPLEIDKAKWNITPVSMGNPHAVTFTENIDSLDLEKIGPAFETHQCFPAKTNTEFVEVISRDKIRMRVWERGAGETLACGTGACAALVASVLNDHTGNEAEVEVRGGSLRIRWDRENNHVYMSGPAEIVFEGNYFPAR